MIERIFGQWSEKSELVQKFTNIAKSIRQKPGKLEAVQEYTESMKSVASRLDAHKALIKLHREDDEIMCVVRDCGTDEWLFCDRPEDDLSLKILTSLPRLMPIDLRWAKLVGADFYEADMHGLRLHGADLRAADLRRAKGLNEDQIRSAHIDGNTMLDPEFDDLKREILAARGQARLQDQPRPEEPHV